MDSSNVSVPFLIEIVERGRDFPPILKKVLDEKSIHVRRSAAFVLGRMGTSAQSAIPILKRIVQDETDSIEVRTMAAVALDKMGENMKSFFQENALTNPLSNQCNGSDPNIHLYAGLCVQEDSSMCGDGFVEIYQTLKGLLEQGEEIRNQQESSSCKTIYVMSS